MTYKKLLLVPGLLLALLLAACASVPNPSNQDSISRIPFETCQLSSPELPSRMEAECGGLEVPEDRASASSKKIKLRIAVLKSVSRNPASDPLFFIPGGPGEAATESFLILSSAFERINQKRDIILVDQRGTGGSNALRCPETEETQDIGQPEAFDQEAIRQSLQACLAGLEGNPALYTTAQAVEDLEQVRSTLGYEQIDLYGASYGTRVALAYLRQYPGRVRTVILDGVAPPNWTLGITISQDAQRALDMIFQRCADDAQCNLAFPDLPARFASLLKTLKNGPVQLTLTNPVSGEFEDFTLTYDYFANTIHILSYAPETAALLPLLITTTFERNDFSLIATQGLTNTDQLTQSISTGMRLSVICTEDMPYFDGAASTAGNSTGGYLGDYFLTSFREICKSWPHGQAPASFKEPVRSDIPVLILSGEADPVTPPANGALSAQTLPNSLHLVIPGSGHINIFRGCIPNIATSFIVNGSMRGLDTACIQSLRPMPFFLTFSGPNP